VGEVHEKCHATLIISTYLVNQIESQYLIIRVIRGRRVFYIAIIYSKTPECLIFGDGGSNIGVFGLDLTSI